MDTWSRGKAGHRVEDQNRGIVEYPELEGTYKDHRVLSMSYLARFGALCYLQSENYTESSSNWSLLGPSSA